MQPEVNPARDEAEKAYEPAPVVRDQHGESSFTRIIEQQTAKVSSDVFLLIALGSMGLSLALELAGRRNASRFIGMWAPSLLIMGVYNKLVKTLGPR